MFPVTFRYKEGNGAGEPDDDDIDIPVPGERADFVGDMISRPLRTAGHIVPQSGAGTQAQRNQPRAPGLGQIAADRPIFTLSVAADLLGLHPRTLRIYEERGLVIPARTDGNRRRYSQNDIQRFGVIRRLTQGGVNLEGVRIILDMVEELNALGGDSNTIIEKNLQKPTLDEP